MDLLFLFLLGAIVGSFLNVVGLRWNSGLGLGGRSFCTVCRKQLYWWELLPVVSFFFLKGRCSKCKTKISWQYALVELWTGLIFVSTYIVVAPATLSFFLVWSLVVSIFCIYIVIVIYDLRHKIIPDPLVYFSIFLALVYRLFADYLLPNAHTFMDWLSGPILFSFFGLIWLLSKGRAMGFGDAKLGLSIGLLLGAAHGFSGIVLAFWIGTLITLIYMFVVKLGFPLWREGKRLTMKSEIPFAPFMIIGAWIAFVYKLDLFHVLSFTR